MEALAKFLEDGGVVEAAQPPSSEAKDELEDGVVTEEDEEEADHLAKDEL